MKRLAYTFCKTGSECVAATAYSPLVFVISSLVCCSSNAALKSDSGLHSQIGIAALFQWFPLASVQGRDVNDP